MPRRNANLIPLPSAARTATTTSPRMRNVYHPGVQVELVVTAASGTGGLTLHVRGYDGKPGNAYDLLVDGSPVTATGTYVFLVNDTAGAAVGVARGSIARPLPKLWDVQVVAGDASSYTYAVNAQMLTV